MTTREMLPLPESTYQLLLDAADAWPDAVATQWIPDPSSHTRCLGWTYAELAGTVTRIANALTALGVRRGDAVTLSSVNTSMLYAGTLAAQAVGIAAPRRPAPAPGPGRARNGPGRSAVPCPGSRSKRSGSATGRGPTAPPARPANW